MSSKIEPSCSLCLQPSPKMLLLDCQHSYCLPCACNLYHHNTNPSRLPEPTPPAFQCYVCLRYTPLHPDTVRELQLLHQEIKSSNSNTRRPGTTIKQVSDQKEQQVTNFGQSRTKPISRNNNAEKQFWKTGTVTNTMNIGQKESSNHRILMGQLIREEQECERRLLDVKQSYRITVNELKKKFCQIKHQLLSKEQQLMRMCEDSYQNAVQNILNTKAHIQGYMSSIQERISHEKTYTEMAFYPSGPGGNIFTLAQNTSNQLWKVKISVNFKDLEDKIEQLSLQYPEKQATVEQEKEQKTQTPYHACRCVTENVDTKNNSHQMRGSSAGRMYSRLSACKVEPAVSSRDESYRKVMAKLNENRRKIQESLMRETGAYR